MCNFFSAIIKKDGTILVDVSDSHEVIKSINNLDDTKQLNELDFYPIEILPKENKTIFDEPTKENFKLNIGASGGHHSETPKWWKKSFETKIWKLFKEVWAERIIYKKEIKELIGKKGLIIKDSKIEIIKDCQIKEMRGSSQVGKMYNSSQVGKMYNSSQVGKMYNSSQVGKMYNSSQVGEMYNSSQVGEMYNSSQVGKMYNSSQVGKMYNSSQVGEMYNSSQVGEMLSKNTTIRFFSENAKLKDLINSKGVIIDFSKDKTEVKVLGK